MEKYLRISMLVLGVFLVGSAIQAITKHRIAYYQKVEVSTQEKIAGKSRELVALKDRERQLDCLARNVYFEAGSESFEGKVAVAQVTLNRAKHPKVVCQFSWYCQNGGKPKIKHPELYRESYEVAKKVLLENFRLSTMKDAIYFHAVYINPNWRKERIGVIGNHVFYKDQNVDI